MTTPTIAGRPCRRVLPNRRTALIALCVLLIAGCGDSVAPAPTPPTRAATLGPFPTTSATATPRPTNTPAPSLDRAASFRAAIVQLADARDRIHPDGWHGMARADWIAAADTSAAKIDTLSDDQALVELVRLAAMPSWNGRDGHTGIFPFIPGSGTHEYPVRWWRFRDGLVITAAGPGVDPGLVGERVVEIGGHPIAVVLALVEPLAPRDNPSNLLAYGPLYLRVSELLAGLGVIDAAEPTTFRLARRNGTEHDVTIAPITPEADGAWNSGLPMRLPPTDALWLKRQAEPSWWTFLDDSGTLYIQQNEVSAGITRLADEIRARAQQPDVNRIVLDLRHNGGGDNTTLAPIEGAIRDPAIDRPGHLFVLFGRITFSAAANFATDLEAETSAVFAGEPMGGSPNLYGDARRIDLPFAGQALYVATRYWQRSTPDDERITIVPDIPVDFSSADYLAGRDPVLDAVIGHGPPSG